MIKNVSMNINKESIKSLKEYKLKQIQSNIKIYIFFLSIITLIDIGLIIFIILFKSRILKIKNTSKSRYSFIKTNSDKLKSNKISIEKKVVNIISSSFMGIPHFSYIFETSDEVQMVKTHIAEFYKDKKGKILDINKMNFLFMFQGVSDGDNFDALADKIRFQNNILIIIETKNKNKFGFFSDDYVLVGDEEYISSDKNCFIFSFTNKQRFDYIGNGTAFKINKDNFYIIGNDDVIINNNFHEKGGKIKFPFKSFDTNNLMFNIFTKNEEFLIKDIEIYNTNLIGVFQLFKQ